MKTLGFEDSAFTMPLLDLMGQCVYYLTGSGWKTVLLLSVNEVCTIPTGLWTKGFPIVLRRWWKLHPCGAVWGDAGIFTFHSAVTWELGTSTNLILQWTDSSLTAKRQAQSQMTGSESGHSNWVRNQCSLPLSPVEMLERQIRHRFCCQQAASLLGVYSLFHLIVCVLDHGKFQ